MPQPYDYSTQQVNVDNYFNSLRQGREDKVKQEAATRQSALRKYMPGALQGNADDRAEVMKNADPEQQIALQDRFDQDPVRKLKQAAELNGYMVEELSKVADGDEAGFAATLSRFAENTGTPPEKLAHLSIRDLPRLRKESGATKRDLELKLQELGIEAKRADIRQSNAAADASRRSGMGGMGGMSNTTFDNISGLRKEYIGATKDFGTVTDAYSRIKATSAAATPAGDLSMIFAYMKMLDPNSVVRESEFALAQNAKPLLDRMGISWDAVKSTWEGTKLQPQVRNDLLKQASALYNQQLKQKALIDGQYTNLSKNFGFDPKFVVTGRAGMPDSDQPPAPPPPPAQTVQRPIITGPGGQRMQLNAAGTAWEPMR